MKLPFNSEKKKICSSSVYGEANIRVGKEFLMKLSFHSDNVQEEYLWSSPSILSMQKKKNSSSTSVKELLLVVDCDSPPSLAYRRKKIILLFLCQRIKVWDSAGWSCLFSILKLFFHSKNTGEEEYLFLFYNEVTPPSKACRRRKIFLLLHL